MRKTEIQFGEQQAVCVFPDRRGQLFQAFEELGIGDCRSVIVLVGGFIQKPHAHVTEQAIEIIAAFAEENGSLVICGGSDLGVMASIGKARLTHQYTFPLLGINLEQLVTWPNGPRGRRSLWRGEDRVALAPGYSHFILVPGSQYGEESPWIAQAATQLSEGNKSLTILANGGSVSRKDVVLSLENRRPVMALAGTGRLADELANRPHKPGLVIIVPAGDEGSLWNALRGHFGANGEKGVPK